MRKFNRANLALELVIMIGGLVGMTQKVAAQDASPIFTVHVNNYAGVDSKTLAEAEKVAAAIFRSAGVEAHWVTDLGTSGEKIEEILDPKSVGLSHLRLSILSPKMASHLSVPNSAMGLAPGRGTDRSTIYVFYGRVEALAQDPANLAAGGPQFRHVTSGLILGHVMTHEIGHVLLNLDMHSATGIMRGNWNMNDLLGAVRGQLVFTTQQAEVIRAEVARRMRQGEDPQTSGLEFASVAR